MYFQFSHVQTRIISTTQASTVQYICRSINIWSTSLWLHMRDVSVKMCKYDGSKTKVSLFFLHFFVNRSIVTNYLKNLRTRFKKVNMQTCEFILPLASSALIWLACVYPRIGYSSDNFWRSLVRWRSERICEIALNEVQFIIWLKKHGYFRAFFTAFVD